MRRTTIQDVADRSGFSITTVSHVMNDVAGKRISIDTRKQVRAAAAALGYSPNRMAQSLRLRRSNTLGFISDQVATSPYAGQIIIGAQHEAAEHGCLLLLMNSEYDSELEEREISTLIDRQVDGIIYAAEHHLVLAPPAGLQAVPNVLLDARSSVDGFSWVVPDEIGGVRAGMKELTDHGHRRIGFVQSSIDMPAARLRLEGYKKALKAAGRAYHRAFVVEDMPEATGGYRAAKALLDRAPGVRPTALLCFNDRMAFGAYQAVAELGLVVGQDVSIVGFDNQEVIAAGLRPGLTTIALPHYEMGKWAVRTLMCAIQEEGKEPPRTELLPCPLVRRASVGPPPRT